MTTSQGRPRGHRIFAAIYDRMQADAERRWLGALRRGLLAGLHGQVLEVGAGTGANLPHYPPRLQRLIITEPDFYMRNKLQAKLAQMNATTKIELREASADKLPFADGELDHVVATMVLCSVPDQRRALGEIYRVLRPGGHLHLIEHVRAESAGWARIQDWVTPIWRRIGAGCHPNRDTAAQVLAAGFQWRELRPFMEGPYIVKPHIVGVAHTAVTRQSATAPSGNQPPGETS